MRRSPPTVGYWLLKSEPAELSIEDLDVSGERLAAGRYARNNVYTELLVSS